ncbi:YybH family protein [Marinibaculum pumilum]|uniref:YybH family protein n=1 Tax=Marinibaculum pumilum TaxID=1766165 RepID=A0ABV7KYZ5_9PROT
MAAPAAQADGAADRDAIRKRLEDWTADFNAGRADRVCDLFAPDLRANYRGQPEKRFGTLCPALKDALADERLAYRYELDLHEILVDQDMAAVRLTWHLTVTDRASGTSEHSSDVGLDIFRRQPNGTWRIARFIAYGEPADD